MVNIGIVGATGTVGLEIIKVLDEKKIPVNNLRVFSSKKSAGKIQKTPFGKKILEEFFIDLCENIDIIFLAVGSEFSKKYAPLLAKKGITVIDNSSAFRYEKDIPLIIPAINAEKIGKSKIISNPNCTTAILGMVLYPLYKEFGLTKVIISTYQATSGAGKPGMDELIEESKNYLLGEKVNNKVFLHPIPFNLIPHIDYPQENNYTKEEMKVTWETHKIFDDSSFPISCTAVRIPTLRAHAESVVIETKKNY
jgi:aspartate-semialdehyde dehydrogenase